MAQLIHFSRFGKVEVDVLCCYVIAFGVEVSEKNDVFQFAHVSGPRIEFQRLYCRCVEVFSLLTGLGGIAFEEEVGDFGDVLGCFFQRRHGDV